MRMTEKRTTPEAGRRKRAAPTIDLTASEVPPVVAASEAPASAPESLPETPPPPPSPPEPPASEQTAAAGNPPGGDSWSWITANFSGPVLMAGLAGAGSVALLLFALWLTGLVPIRYAGSTATRARVAAMEMEIQALQHRPTGAVDPKAIDALTERVGKMETAISQLPAGDPTMADRVAALNRRSDGIAADATQARAQAEAAVKAVTELRSSVQIASTASAGLSSADLDALQKRIADLEQTAKAARDDIAKTGAADATARLALSAASLRDVATSGAPFAPALAQAKALGADAKTLAPLEPFAASGVPSAVALAGELRALLPGMIKQSGAQAPSGGFLEKLQANASNLVRVRPVGAPAGDDASAVLARVEIEAANADIGGALADLGKLPDATRTPAQAWISKAQARQAALAAARTLAVETANTLANPLGTR
jgi:hypothetical protein